MKTDNEEISRSVDGNMIPQADMRIKFRQALALEDLAATLKRIETLLTPPPTSSTLVDYTPHGSDLGEPVAHIGPALEHRRRRT